MLRGLFFGAVGGLSVSALAIATISLIAPPPVAQTHRPVAAPPDAPVLRDQADAAPRVPDALPRRGPEQPIPQEPARNEAPVAAAQTLGAADAVATAGAVAAAVTAAQPVAERAPPVLDAARPAVDGAGAVPLPVASAFNRPREDGEVVTPEADPVSRPALASDGLRVAAPVPRDGPLPQTQSATRPPEARVAALGAGPEAGQGPNLPRTPAETAPQARAEAPAAGVPRLDEEVTIVIETHTAPPRTTPPAAPLAAPPRQRGPEPDGGADTGPDGAPDTPQVAADTASSPAGPARPPAVSLVEEDDRVTPPPAAEAPRAPATPAPENEATIAPDDAAMPRRVILDGARQAATAQEDTATGRRAAPEGALEREAAAFDNPGNLPLLAIVLIEDPAGGSDRDGLADLGFPVTIAIDPTRPDAAAAARAHRAAGNEVLMLAAPLAAGGTAQDVEVAMGAARIALPQALGVLDLSGGAADDFATNRTALAALLPALAEAGMGFLATSGGLNSGIATARRGGVAAMPVARALDDGDSAAAILRALDRASLAAVQDGAVVVVGHARPETLAAIGTWRQGARSGDVAAAPVSAVLSGFGR